jgi:hypothetical protein
MRLRARWREAYFSSALRFSFALVTGLLAACGESPSTSNGSPSGSGVSSGVGSSGAGSGASTGAGSGAGSAGAGGAGSGSTASGASATGSATGAGATGSAGSSGGAGSAGVTSGASDSGTAGSSNGTGITVGGGSGSMSAVPSTEMCEAPATVPALADDNYVSTTNATGSFALAASGQVAPLVVNAADWPGVVRVAGALQGDIQSVTGTMPTLEMDTVPSSATQAVIIGTVGKSALITQLVNAGKLDVSGIQGKWENYLIQIVASPMAGVDSALVIAGSDKRGTIFGMYDVSSRIGVSPWNWWADVPIPTQSSLYITAGAHTSGPAIKYRGIFINDENPCADGNVQEKFGGWKSSYYVKVFDLILRLKGNYLWPAMWDPKEFNVDDPMNAPLADEYGIVMGTSHEEPMMRNQEEWDAVSSTLGAWDYPTNAANLNTFWTGGITRMGTKESLVTIGMRGENDTSLASTTDVPLLESIITDQRGIIGSALDVDASTVPQIWTVYKDIEAYYDQGERAPSDVITSFTDDNFGNLVRLPTDATPPAGGYGLYYHFDYVGTPRDYKWINTNPIARVWEQLHMAYANGVTSEWIVNVGDLKPMEFPMSFFFDYAWNPNRIAAGNLPAWSTNWAAQQFGQTQAGAIAGLITDYAKFNGRRKPELVDQTTYSVTNYREGANIVAAYNQDATTAQTIVNALPSAYQAAFYQLVQYPVEAVANLNEMYVADANNLLYAGQGRASAADQATLVGTDFTKDGTFSTYYNQTLSGGKWDHYMDQTHIGYTTWSDPATQTQPATMSVSPGTAASMGVGIEGASNWWPNSTSMAVLPELGPYQAQTNRYIEVFNRGKTAFNFTATSTASWLTITPASGSITEQTQLLASVADWTKAPTGTMQVPITITGPNNATVTVELAINNPTTPASQIHGFVESDGYASIEAEHYACAVGASPIQWTRIPDFGRTLSGMTPMPVTSASQTPGTGTPHLDYAVYLFSSGSVKVDTYISPTLDVFEKGLHYAVSIDDGPIQTVTAVTASTANVGTDDPWNTWVSNNIIVGTTPFTVSSPGQHLVKFWMVDPGVVLQKVVVETTGVRTSYLGPPESVNMP